MTPEWARPAPRRRGRFRRWLPLMILGAVIAAGSLLNHDHRAMEAAWAGATGSRLLQSTGPESTAPLIPVRVQGSIADRSSGSAIPRAIVQAGGSRVVADDGGRFLLEAFSGEDVQVQAPGYAPLRVRLGADEHAAFELEPRQLRGAYLTFFGAAEPSIRDHVVDMLSSGALNALVVDVKGDRGYLLYRSSVPLAEGVGANDLQPMPDADAFIGDLKARGVYLIARIVVFKDDVLARNGPRAGIDVAISDGTTGAVWTDLEGLGWIDPFREEAWDYNIAIAEEAIRKGFDEVQFDYVRFPTDPGRGTLLDRARYSRVANVETRTGAIADFLSRAHRVVNAAGGALSADVFGYVCWREDDMGIGQHLETIATAVDYVSPMIYPSTFNGLPTDPDYAISPHYPYEIAYYSLQRAKERLAGTGVAIRPWLQYFDDYPWATGKQYGTVELAAQRQAVEELGLPGWMWWDPTNLYRFGPSVSLGE